ncbi:YlmC/YmxH family sporulation protein [Clostridium massiliodielmoense]|uniref:YlmC/YmxH family sporulation protein n=1 Tax=Clostridium massiliodielmoense TaxID=1776385 RepID=UPI000316BFA5|nr:YlmC/YmxH family sporulation protein [Clostridium massiliodielmoense]KEH97901.1 photosystem reaction center subunit H [Clostridium botulinum C/D str. BKT12695]NEZ48238.1 YlmC/YmxH family sporulation protein [Clostridium botulinum]
MNENIKLYSDVENCEIININNGEKYNYVYNNDVIIDKEGNFKFLIINDTKPGFRIFKSESFLEVPWEHINKIGAKTIIMDVEENELKKLYK